MSLAQAIHFTLEAESGELSDDPNDPGGLTRWGVALKRHPELTADDIRNMTRERAGQIFADAYWPDRADELPDYLSIPLLASSVLQGRETAVEILQTALGVHADGSIGPQTISAARLANRNAMLSRYLGEQVRQLRKGSAWQADGIGWVMRATRAMLEGL